MSILRLCDQESATVPPESTAAEAIRLMLARRVGAVVVVDANRVVGIFTERDVLKKLALSGRDPEKVRVAELMTAPVETVSPETNPKEALGSMLEHHFRHLPVVDSSGRLRGVLSIRNLLHGQMEDLRRQLHSLEHHVASEEPGATKARG
jgi:CBS domain-containing protein